MSLDDTLDPIERAKLAVWDYPVSNKYTKLWETMKLSGFPNSLDEALTSVKNGTFAYIGMANRGGSRIWCWGGGRNSAKRSESTIIIVSDVDGTYDAGNLR